MLAYGVPGFISRRRWKLSIENFSVFTQNFPLQLYPTSSLDVGLFFSHLFPLLLSLSFSIFHFLCNLLVTHLHTLPFTFYSLEFLCKLYKVNKLSVLCLCSLSLSLLEPSYQDEIGVARLQWRQKSGFQKN